MTDEQIVALVEDAESGLKAELLERLDRFEAILLNEFRKSVIRIEAIVNVQEA